MEREILENGSSVRQNSEGLWIANVALEEYNPKQERSPWGNNPPPEKLYTFIQANGKTREEAIMNLNKMAWDMMSKIAEEIPVLESRRTNIAMWLDGCVKGELIGLK